MTCKYAIIPVAGYGSRRLPITKAIEKCMLPILNRPIIDYVVQDCVRAGIKHIILVVSEQNEQFMRYFGHNPGLEKYLIDHGKTEYLELIKAPEDVKFEFITQPADVPYGTATPVALARSRVPKGEPAVVLMGDDILYTGDDRNPIAELIEAAGIDSAALTTEVDISEVSKYGVLACDEDGNLDHMVEKPTADEAPSTMINISKYVFTSDLLDEIETFYREPSIPGQEKYINVEPFNRYMAKGGKVKVVRASGVYLDTGTLEKWLYANNYIAKDQGLLSAL
jgi:UTP--glucose-1-phosphate uridylyltransferase